MISPIIATGLLSGYILIMALMLSQISHVSNMKSNAKSDIALDFVRVKRDLIGLYGKDLFEYFKTTLPRLPPTSDFGNSNQPLRRTNISRLYDSFHNYLFFESGTSVVQKLTQDVTIVPNAHSHNDYWRSLPLFEALVYGITSVEADVWLTENDTSLSVSHDRRHIDPKHKTLDLLYTSPILKMLDEVNDKSKDFSGDNDNQSLHGVFYGASSQSLQLLIDFKSEDNSKTYFVLMNKYLKPFVEKNYLSYVDLITNEVVKGPMTIVLTGNYPNETNILDNSEQGISYEEEGLGFFADNKRYVFLDLPLHDKEAQDKLPTSVLASASLSQLLTSCRSSPYIAKFHGHLSDNEVKCIRTFIEHAKENNLTTRIWGVPEWPVSRRNTLWNQQYYDIQVDYINTDDLKAISEF
ncbi:Altered inheritance of mitochondria protein 6 [Kluyveromyces marxianus]|nr:Altered inheritance of mitochondria protein 6 [Kluyveromyces marxianus]KAG0685447.1 Altered inheritance of mitochondria protein 6 [Kluyveromyces marxianus]